MTIRFLTTIASAQTTFRGGQVIHVACPTPEMLAWLQPLPDGTVRAEVVRDEGDAELAVMGDTSEDASLRRGRARGRR
jgi:hypothetical protein